MNDFLKILQTGEAKGLSIKGTIKVNPQLIDGLIAESARKPPPANAGASSVKVSEMLKLVKQVTLKVDQGAAYLEFDLGA